MSAMRSWISLSEAERSWQSRAAGPACLVAAFCALAAWTWRKWPDVLIDFGREVYVPWQLADGAVLYRDLAYFNGPLSPYWNALLFRLFGVSMTTLIIANAFILASLTALLYRWIVRLADRLTALLACLLMLSAFGFAHLLAVGNYNFICPYSHELTHGVTLSFVMLLLLSEHARSDSRTKLAVAGLCWGLVFLTKAEVFLAASGAAAVGLVLPVLAKQTSVRRAVSSCGIFVAAGLLPALTFSAYFAQHMPLGQSLLATSGTWRWVFGSEVTQLHFYHAISGLNAPLANLLGMAKSAFCVALILIASASYDRMQSESHRRFRWMALIGLCLASIVLLRERMFPYLLDGRALLIAGISMTLIALCSAWRFRYDRPATLCFQPLATWGVFATLLLSKMLLLPRIQHYGFALAMPVTILAAIWAVGLLPRYLCRGWQGGETFRKVMIGLLVADTLGYVLMSSANLRNKSFPVGLGGDRIATYDSQTSQVGPALAQCLRHIESRLPEDATLMALPEGIMINYLSRRRNPTGYLNLMPPELAMYGEDRIVDVLAQRMPDYILLVHKDTSEYGVGFFGTEAYGSQILDWVKQHYGPVETILAEPFRTDQFGIQILERTSRSDSLQSYSADTMAPEVGL